MAEITIDGTRYVCRKLDAKSQYEILRRLGPAVAIFQQPVTDDHAPGARMLMGVTMDVLSRMPQEDSDFINNTCFSVISKVGSDGKATAIFQRQTGQLMFQDMEADVFMELVDFVIQDSLGGFFGRLRALSNSAQDSQAQDQDQNQS